MNFFILHHPTPYTQIQISQAKLWNEMVLNWHLVADQHVQGEMPDLFLLMSDCSLDRGRSPSLNISSPPPRGGALPV